MVSGYLRTLQIVQTIQTDIVKICDQYYNTPKLYHKDCIAKFYPINTNLSLRIVKMKATKLKNGQWCMDDRISKLPGIVSKLQYTKPGKHGYGRYSFYLSSPFSSNKKIESFRRLRHGGEDIYCPIMKTLEFLISSISDDDLICLDENYEEVIFKISKDRKQIYDEIWQKFNKAQNKGVNVYAVVLEGPINYGHEIQILQMVSNARLENES